MNSNDSEHRSKNYPPYASEGDNTMPNPQRIPSNTEFFSSQKAFYPPSNQATSEMELLGNNQLLDVGLNVVRKGMKDITIQTFNRFPNQMKTSLSSIKYYFAVDQTYVFKKLSLLLFPFRSRNWSLSYSADEPAPPRLDTNAPDYYIPLMSAISYVLIAGLVLGTQNRFTPEQLGTHALSVFIWSIIENCLLSLILYVFNIQSKLRTFDLVGYCGYKYVGMIAALSLYLVTHSLFVYRCALLYVSISLSYFLMKCLRLQILPDTGGFQSGNSNGNIHRIYLLLLIIILQPLSIWYLTRHLIII